MATRNTTAIPGEVVEGLTAETATQIMRTQALQPAHSSDEDSEVTLADRLRELIAGDAGATVKIKLYRINTRTGAMEWCRDYMGQELQNGDLEPIREEWGAGMYELRIYGRQGLLGKPRVSIAETARSQQYAQQPVQPAADSGIERALMMLAESQRAILDRLSAPPPPAPDPMQMMVQMGTVFATMRQAFAPAGETAASKSPFDQVKELLQVTREVKSAARELQDDSPASEPESVMGLAGKALDAIRMLAPAQQAQALQAVQHPQHFPPVQPLHVPASIPPAHNPTAPPTMPAPVENTAAPATAATPTPAGESLEQMQLRQAIELLCALAAAGRDPVEGGQVIYERLPDELIDHMENPNWFPLVCQVFPALQPHETWMRSAKAEADRLFADDDSGDDDTVADAAGDSTKNVQRLT